MNRIEADCRVAPSHPSLRGHFPGHPIVPAVLLLDEVIAIAERAAGSRVAGVKDAKFTLALRPDEAAHVLCEVDGNQVSFCVSVLRDCAKRMVATGKLLLECSERLTA